MLQNEAEITPNSLLVFNHPENKAILNIKHGSGDFQVDLSTKSRLQVAKVDYSLHIVALVVIEFASNGKIRDVNYLVPKSFHH